MSFHKRVPWIAVLAGVALLAFAACGDDEEEGATPTATPTLGPQAQRPATAQEVQAEAVTPTDGVIEVEEQDNKFTTNNFQVVIGEEVVFSVTNAGNNPHTFTIAGLDGQFDTADDITTTTLNAGEHEDLVVSLDVGGTYVFRCNIHPTEMWGEIRASQVAGAQPGTVGY